MTDGDLAVYMGCWWCSDTASLIWDGCPARTRAWLPIVASESGQPPWTVALDLVLLPCSIRV